MVDHQVDVAIVGGGLIGAAMMQALAPTGLRCVLIDQQALPARLEEDFDARSVALSNASMRILRGLKIWPTIEAAAAKIVKIHVSEQYRFGTACLEATYQNPLGYVIDNQTLLHTLYESLNPDTLLMPATIQAFDAETRTATVKIGKRRCTVQAPLFVAADGSNSMMRKFCQLPVHIKDYGQHALVANIGLARAHDNIAYERFTAAGPLALLPLGPKRMALVWSMSPAAAETFLQMKEADFLQALTRAFGYRLGRLLKVGRRTVFPLQQMVMPVQSQHGVVFIGNAAHTLHPVAGQGFNLGLRDVAMLAQTLVQEGVHHPDLLSGYLQARKHDHLAITQFTDALIQIFTSKIPGVAWARQIGLLAVDNHRALQRFVARYASGFSGVVPDLVCGLPLEEIT
ncbi:MAG: FAD-dependent monooxygenase [Gammaproteobacteria bacterium]|nr:FAD-dependent monooxygenase [Gammaproteobacteria bacterium]